MRKAFCRHGTLPVRDCGSVRRCRCGGNRRRMHHSSLKRSEMAAIETSSPGKQEQARRTSLRSCNRVGCAPRVARAAAGWLEIDMTEQSVDLCRHLSELNAIIARYPQSKPPRPQIGCPPVEPGEWSLPGRLRGPRPLTSMAHPGWVTAGAWSGPAAAILRDLRTHAEADAAAARRAKAVTRWGGYNGTRSSSAARAARCPPREAGRQRLAATIKGDDQRPDKGQIRHSESSGLVRPIAQAP